jgi:hypothetical protein
MNQNQNFKSGQQIVANKNTGNIRAGQTYTVERYSGARLAEPHVVLKGDHYGRYAQSWFTADAKDGAALQAGDKLTVVTATAGLKVGDTATFVRNSTIVQGMGYVEGIRGRVELKNFAKVDAKAAQAQAKASRLQKLFAEVEKLIDGGATELKINAYGNSDFDIEATVSKNVTVSL